MGFLSFLVSTKEKDETPCILRIEDRANQVKIPITFEVRDFEAGCFIRLLEHSNEMRLHRERTGGHLAKQCHVLAVPIDRREIEVTVRVDVRADQTARSHERHFLA